MSDLEKKPMQPPVDEDGKPMAPPDGKKPPMPPVGPDGKPLPPPDGMAGNPINT